MTEPDVTLTDYLLALICSGFAWNLFRHNKNSLLSIIWVVFFASVAVASITGGTVHGFYQDEAQSMHQLLWSSTLLTIGVTATSCWILSGFFISGRAQLTKWIIFASFLFIIYAGLVIFYTQNFALAIMNYLPPMMLLLIVMLFHFLKTKITGFSWIIGGILISFLAAAIQQAGVGLHPVYMNHNSTYHILQALGLWFIFKGAKNLIDLEKETQ